MIAIDEKEEGKVDPGQLKRQRSLVQAQQSPLFLFQCLPVCLFACDYVCVCVCHMYIGLYQSHYTNQFGSHWCQDHLNTCTCTSS